MKKTLQAMPLLWVFTILLSSCKQDETAALANPGNGNTSAGGQTARVMEDCFYAKLTETSPGIWEANFANTNLRFTGLYIRNDGRLYGRLLAAENNNIITGGDGYDRRDFAFERIVCSGGGGVTKTTQLLSYTQFMSNSGGNSSYVYYGGTFSSGAAFSVWAQSSLASGITYTASTGIYEQTHYQWNTPMNCNSTQVIIGKLIAKGVIRLPGGNHFSWSEFGISNMCYPDPPITSGEDQ